MSVSPSIIIKYYHYKKTAHHPPERFLADKPPSPNCMHATPASFVFCLGAVTGAVGFDVQKGERAGTMWVSFQVRVLLCMRMDGWIDIKKNTNPNENNRKKPLWRICAIIDPIGLVPLGCMPKKIRIFRTSSYIHGLVVIRSTLSCLLLKDKKAKKRVFSYRVQSFNVCLFTLGRKEMLLKIGI